MSFEFPVTIDKDILSQYREELEYTNQEVEMLAIDLERNPNDMATVEQIRNHIQGAWMSSVKLELVPLSESLADSLKGLDLLLDWQAYPPAMTEFILGLLDRLMIIAREVEENQFIDMRKTQAILVALQYIILAKDFTQINQGIESAIRAINEEDSCEQGSVDNNEVMLFDDSIDLFDEPGISETLAEPQTNETFSKIDIFVPKVSLNPLLQARDFIAGHSVNSTIKILAGSFDHAVEHQRSHANFLAELALTTNLIAGNPLELEMLYSGICLHDVALVPMAELVTNAGKLTPDDIDQLQLHPVKGADVASILNLPVEVSEMILHHHEHVDGSGFPFGLSGGNISEPGKLLAIVDSFHGTMEKLKDQPERSQVLQAVIEVNKQMGGYFDSLWMKFFNKTIRDYWLPDWRAEKRRIAG